MTATLPHLAGVIDGLDETAYHANPALSVSGAKKLLAPSCPAIYRWEADHGQQPKAAFDFGHAVHTAVLGTGADEVVVDADNWMGKAAKEARAQAYADGKVPLLAKDKAAVDQAADAVRAHPLAGQLFTDGRPEVSLFWRDWVTGVQRRARVDWLPNPGSGRLTLVDLKTCVSAEPSQVRKAIANFRYEMQAAWYMDGAHALELGDDVGFRFVFVEKTPPHLVTVVELDAEAVRAGRARNDEALRVFAQCSESGVWPGYADDVVTVGLPSWAAPRPDWGDLT